jgi:hypothetical protein
MKRVITSLLVTAVALAGCDLLNQSNTDDPTSPSYDTVDHVAISPESTVVVIGNTVKLNAYPIGKDGNAMAGKAATWYSYNVPIATVDNAGNVTGSTVGVATIYASVDGVRGGAYVRVVAPNTPPPPPPPPPPSSGLTITAAAPIPFVEGGQAFLQGTGFGNVPSNLWVYVDGIVAKVSATNGTMLQFTVPTTGKPAHNAEVKVRLLTQYSNTGIVPIKP